MVASVLLLRCLLWMGITHLLCASASAQQMLSLAGGYAFSSVTTNNPNFNEITSLGGPALGLEYSQKVGTRLNLGIGIMAEGKGFALHVDARQTFDRPPVVQSPDFQLHFTYMALPLTMQLSFGQRTYGLVAAGLAPAYAVAATGRIPVFDGAETDRTLQGEKPLELNDHNRWDLETIAGLGIGQRIGTRWQVELKATYLHGLVAIQSQYLLAPYAMRNRAGALLLSVGYHWGKE